MKRAFAALLRLYPAEYRALFASEMAGVFEEGRRDALRRGRVCYALFLASELAGLLRGAAMERGIDWSRRPKRSRSVSFLAGAVVSAAVLRVLLRARALPVAGFRTYPHDDLYELIALATVSVVLIAGLSLAFVLNLRGVVRSRSRRA